MYRKSWSLILPSIKNLGGTFEHNFCPRGLGIWTNQSSKNQMQGGLPVVRGVGGGWGFELIDA